jgi:MFS transporter, putative metabolite transport protein
MSAPQLSIDDAAFAGFHRRLALYSCGGPFCDGYILGIIAIALAPLSQAIGLTLTWQGLIAAATLAGMFIGGSVFGYVTDRVGRRVMYSLDLLLLVLASAAQFWVQDPWSLFALRFILGVAIGADYPIATALLSEFAPKRQRGMLLALMIGTWWLGYTVSFIAGYAFSIAGGSWRVMLASSAVPAALVSLLRLGTPESPRWLVAHGRIDEARELVRRHLGGNYGLDETRPARTHYGSIFRAPYAKRTVFVCLFWSCQIIPSFAIYTFAPELLRAFGSPNPTLGAALMSLFFLAGVIPAILLVDRVGRRPLLTIPFAVTGATMVLLALVPKTAGILIALCFIVFAVFNAGSSVLQWIYPTELFPTEVRATALGFATAVSRIGAAAGTFLFPIGLHRLGVSNVMLIVGGICAVGWVLSLSSAPETRGLSLTEASRVTEHA